MLTRFCLVCSSRFFVILLPLFQVMNGEFSHGEQQFGAFRLKEYNSFGDVTLIHVIVPPRCVQARWNVSVLKDNAKCPKTTVNIAIQPRSLPLTNPYNTSFPAHSNTGSQRYLNMITMLSNQGISVLFYTPVAGNWFMASFLPKSKNNKIEQQGLGGITCHYFMQIGVSYVQEQDIESLGSQTRTVVELSAEENGFTYRFYVPSLTKTITFSYQDCRVQPGVNQTVGDLCPVEFRVSPNSLPNIGKTPPVICESNTSCSVEVEQPLEDTWYYIGLNLAASGQIAVNLNLGVNVQTCKPDDAGFYSIPSDEMDSQTWAFSPNASLASAQSIHLHNTSASLSPALSDEDAPEISPYFPPESLKIHVASPFPSSYLADPVPKPAPFSPDWCPPVLPLSSFQLGGSNPYKIFLRNAANSSDGLGVPPTTPVILKFELDLLQDIGGNLIIKSHIIKEAQDGNQTSINLCLTWGAIPPLNGTRISCDPDYSVTFNNNSIGSVFPWNIPFPASGVWYISLESTCELNNGTVPCTEDTFVYLEIGLYGCIDGCGNYGSCHSAIDMGLLYYYCKCTRGYQGWGCTDDSEAWSQGYFVSRVLLLTLSNIFFIFPCLLALKRRHFVPAISYFCTLIFSSFYHSCDSGSLCIMSFNTLQFCDFFSAFMAIFLTLITMAKLPTPLKHSLEILGAFGLVLGTSYNRFSLWTAAVPVGVGITVLLLSWSRRWYKRRRCYPTTKRRWLLFILPGAAVIVTGLCIFAFLETSDNYQYVHSAWHVSMAIGVMCLLPPRERNDKQHYNHMSELVDINTLNSELVVNDDPGY